MGKAGKKFYRNGVEYDSLEETYFAMWLDELKQNAYVRDWERWVTPLEITPSFKNTYKAGKKEKTQSVLQNLEYTPDFIIYWSAYSNGIFYTRLGEKITTPFIVDGRRNCSTVEVKPSFDRNNMTRLFRQVQKVLWKFHNEFINLVMIEKLFGSTFTPQEYLKTKTGKDRKITKWKVRTLEEFLDGHKTKFT